jgi:FkbM family methyltransferase
MTSGLDRLKKVNSAAEIEDSIRASYRLPELNLDEVYIFGAQRLGETIAGQCETGNIKIKAFIDNDIRKHGKSLCGRAIIPLEAVENRDAVIIVASKYLAAIGEQLEEEGFSTVIPFPALALIDASVFAVEAVFDGTHDDMMDNISSYLKLYELLADDQSRNVLDAILNFRLSYDATYLKSVGEPPERMYFDDVIKLTNNEVFVDGGGFDGDTAAAFISRTGHSYKKIMLFEPDQTLLDKARERLKGQKDIEFYGYGLFSRTGTLRFQLTGDLDGFISDSGEIEISTVALDELTKDDITLLKLDIEGSELDAIEGAARHISEDKLKMAICVYHKPAHLWQLPFRINELRPDCQFYLRHYSDTHFDTVLYAVPNGGFQSGI